MVMHAAGLAHLDLKPGNVIMTEDGKAKVADFGATCAIDQHTGKLAVQSLRRDQQVDKLVTTLTNSFIATQDSSLGVMADVHDALDTLTAADAAHKELTPSRSCPGDLLAETMANSCRGDSGLEVQQLGLVPECMATTPPAMVHFRCSSTTGGEVDTYPHHQGERGMAPFSRHPAYSLRDVPMVWPPTQPSP
jgi:serine/threonine protein kinase